MIKHFLTKLIQSENLNQTEAKEAMEIIMKGNATPSQIASFITALRIKGETTDEITGFVETMRSVATKINVSVKNAVDTCGTGGDGKNTINVSTLSAFVACGAGVTVAKHGNRAASSKCGSADVLAELGVNLDIDPAKVEECITKTGIGFLFAPKFHKAMIHAIGPRKEIGFRTVFNILGPLTNPAGVKRQLLGVFDKKLGKQMVQVLHNLGSKRVFVVHGEDGVDEVSINAPTHVSELRNGKITHYTITPEDFGIQRNNLDTVAGGHAQDNKQLFQAILNGEQGAGRDIIVLNAALAITASDDSLTIKDGIEQAKQSIDSGSALQKLTNLTEVSNS